MSYQVIWEKFDGDLIGELPVVVQGSALETITILALYRDGSNVDLSGMTVTATMTDRAGTTYGMTGAFVGADGSFAWKPSAGDVGTAGRFDVIVTYSDGSDVWRSDSVQLVVVANPAATAVQNDALVGVTSAEAAWVTAGKTAVPDGADLVDANDLGSAAYAATGDFDAAGSAAAAQTAAQSYADGLNTTMDGRVDILEAALIPVAVADMAATTNGSAAIDLAWTYTAVAPITGFKIYRKSGAGAYSLIDTAADDATSYADSGLTQSTEYTYRVDAYNTFFQTAGNEDAATTDASVGISTTLNAGDITPTFGSELVVNGDMELDSNWLNFLTPTTNERSSEQAHGGTYSRKMVGDGNGDGIYQNISVTSGLWYRIVGWAYVSAGNAKIQAAAQLPLISATLNAAAWTQVTMIGRAVSTASTQLQGAQTATAATTAYFDDFSLKALTFSTGLSLLGDILRSTGTWRCTPTVAAGTQAGLAINYTDANNLVLAYVNRYDGKAYLDKRVGGTWTNVINGAVTYGPGKELAVVVSGTTYSLYYDGTQVGTGQTISDSLGTAVYGFVTDSTNAVGNVATDSATTYAPA